MTSLPDDGTLLPDGGARRPYRIETDAEHVGHDLTKVVLSLVELVRQLVERQCVRRMEQGTLSDDQVEILGLTLLRLSTAMGALCDQFGLTRDELHIDIRTVGILPPAAFLTDLSGLP